MFWWSLVVLGGGGGNWLLFLGWYWEAVSGSSVVVLLSRDVELSAGDIITPRELVCCCWVVWTRDEQTLSISRTVCSARLANAVADQKMSPSSRRMAELTSSCFRALIRSIGARLSLNSRYATRRESEIAYGTIGRLHSWPWKSSETIDVALVAERL